MVSYYYMPDWYVITYMPKLYLTCLIFCSDCNARSYQQVVQGKKDLIPEDQYRPNDILLKTLKGKVTYWVVKGLVDSTRDVQGQKIKKFFGVRVDDPAKKTPFSGYV